MNKISARHFKSLLRAKHDVSETIVYKSAVGVEQKQDRQVRFTISTDAVDRDNDRIDQKGWDLRDFQKNAVFLWSHMADQPPLGKVVQIGLEDGALKATVEFVPADNPWVGAQAEGALQMCKQGFLSAVSVGFMPIEWDLTEDKSRGADGWNPGVDFHRQTLFELSLCPVPANPEALIERVSVLDMPKAVSTLDITRTLNNNDREKRQRLIALYSFGDKI